jgi:pyruvate/2-oxoglutarate dehydrogenase complex dihydrolipoamide dehydrogenase (E3) component
MGIFDYDIGVIGGGAAGLTVASGAAQLGARTVLLEKEPLLGGDCLHFGCVPSKTLIKSASLYHQAGRFESYGLPKIQPPPIDFSLIKARINEVIATIQRHDSVERFNQLGVDVVFADPAFSDNHEVDTGERKISARKWVIATGSSAAMVPLAGLADIEVLTNREIFSLGYLPESLIIIGAGPIGIEMSQAFNRLGTKVTVLQRSSRILSKEDAQLSLELQRVLEDEGVLFHLGCEMRKAYTEKGVKKILIRTAAGEDLVVTGTDILVAAGRSVNIDGLKLENAAVHYSRGGIDVDTRLRTSRKNIYGAGDVIGGYQFTHAAGYEGGVVVSNSVVGLPRKVDYQWMPHCTYSDPEIGGMGLSEEQVQERGIDYRVYEEIFGDNDRAQAEGETTGRIKLLLDKRDKVLGVRIFGFHAGDLLGQWSVLLNGGVKLSVAASSVQPYPTVAEINKKVIGSVLSKKIFSDKVRGLLKFIHRYGG